MLAYQLISFELLSALPYLAHDSDITAMWNLCVWNFEFALVTPSVACNQQQHTLPTSAWPQQNQQGTLTSNCNMQSVMSSAQSLSDITDERVVPVDYLGVLILLFLFMVLDRLFYTLGLHLGKVGIFIPCQVPCPALSSLPCPALPCLTLLCPAFLSALPRPASACLYLHPNIDPANVIASFVLQLLSFLHDYLHHTLTA
jgi:hypothetical protein